MFIVNVRFVVSRGFLKRHKIRFSPNIKEYGFVESFPVFPLNPFGLLRVWQGNENSDVSMVRSKVIKKPGTMRQSR